MAQNKVFLISDLHLGHENILRFDRPDGTKLRPNFRDLHHMHAVICENWCRVVSPQDKVYVLGDVAFKKDALELMRGWPGHKRLVRGNHDLFTTNTYFGIFEEIYGVRQLDGYWLTHVPMHPESLSGRAKANIHGHLHANKLVDKRYVNVSVECIDYTPVDFEDIKKRFE